MTGAGVKFPGCVDSGEKEDMAIPEGLGLVHACRESVPSLRRLYASDKYNQKHQRHEHAKNGHHQHVNVRISKTGADGYAQNEPCESFQRIKLATIGEERLFAAV